MTYAFYETEKQFQQAALVFVAVSLNESAGRLISDGNIAQAVSIHAPVMGANGYMVV